MARRKTTRRTAAAPFRTVARSACPKGENAGPSLFFLVVKSGVFMNA
jgi:hypothetical protein